MWLLLREIVRDYSRTKLLPFPEFVYRPVLFESEGLVVQPKWTQTRVENQKGILLCMQAPGNM